jgi:uncharacterized protein (TIGR00369 family)
MTDLAALQKRLDPLFPGLMGVQLDEATPERVAARLPVRPDLCTTGGILHGGATMAFADTLGAVGTFLNLPPGKMTTTTDSSTKFVRGAGVALSLPACHRFRSIGRKWTPVWVRLENGRKWAHDWFMPNADCRGH